MNEWSIQKGSVVLEYIIVLGVAVPFILFWTMLYESGNGYTDVGLQFMNYFQRILTGISLPIP